MATLEHAGEWGHNTGSKLGWLIAGRLVTALLLSVTVVATAWAVREARNAARLGQALTTAERRLAENYLDRGLGL